MSVEQSVSPKQAGARVTAIDDIDLVMLNRITNSH